MIHTSDGETYASELDHAFGTPDVMMSTAPKDKGSIEDILRTEGSIENDPYATTDLTGKPKPKVPSRGEFSKEMKDEMERRRDQPFDDNFREIPGQQIEDPQGLNRDTYRTENQNYLQLAMDLTGPKDPFHGKPDVGGAAGPNIVPMRNPANTNVKGQQESLEFNRAMEKWNADTERRVNRALDRAQRGAEKGDINYVDKKLIEKHKDTFPEIYEKLKQLTKDLPTRIHPEKILDPNLGLSFSKKPNDPTNITPLKPN